MVKSESRGRDRSQGGARREAPRARPTLLWGQRHGEEKAECGEQAETTGAHRTGGGSWSTHQMDTSEAHPSPPWPPQHRKL